MVGELHNLVMNKLLMLALLVSLSAFADDEVTNPYTTKEEVDQPISTDVLKDRPRQSGDTLLSTDIREENRFFNPRKSHFNISFGFEGMKYNTPFEFDGVKSDFATKDRELWGGRLGLQGEIYLGSGFNTTTKVEGYYMGTLFSRVLNGGAEDEDVKFAYTKRTGQIFGMDASQSIGYLFDFKTKNPFMDEWAYLTMEPFIEAGIGIASAYNRINYSYNLATTNERYKESINDDLTNAKIGVGLNLTSRDGFFFYMKATQNRYDVTLRKVNRYTRDNSGTVTDPGTEKQKNVSIDPIMVYAIGGGYKF